MLKEAIKEAATIEEARQAAAAELGLTADEVQMEVLQARRKRLSACLADAPRGYGYLWKLHRLLLRRNTWLSCSKAWARKARPSP